jgi:hypothetical protein
MRDASRMSEPFVLGETEDYTCAAHRRALGLTQPGIINQSGAARQSDVGLWLGADE